MTVSILEEIIPTITSIIAEQNWMINKIKQIPPSSKKSLAKSLAEPRNILYKIKKINQALQSNPEQYHNFIAELKTNKRLGDKGKINKLHDERKRLKKLERIQLIKERPPETWTDEERMLVNNLRMIYGVRHYPIRN